MICLSRRWKMARAYSLDLRERVIRYLEEGHGVNETAKVFKISSRNMSRWKRRKIENKLEANDNKKRKAKKLEGEKLKKYIIKHPDKTLADIGRVFGASGAAVFKRIRVLGISYKKK
jgi:transposase